MILKTLQRSDISRNIAGWHSGAGPELFLIHGVGLNADFWSAMVPKLIESFSVTIVDMPGHGRSACLATGAGLADYGDTIAEAINGPSVIVGHSMGALIALDLAIRHPDLVAAAVPLNAIYRRTPNASAAVRTRAGDLESGSSPDINTTVSRWFGDAASGELKDASEYCRKWLSDCDLAGYAQAYRIFADEDGPTDGGLKSAKAPMLFMTGGEELNSIPSMSMALADRVAGGKCVIIDGARHMMPMTHADQVNGELIDFANAVILDNG